uniref:Oxidative stress-responsive serine-rich protein 1 n=1 Tax=Caenorhabditis tropicalis TaxID=1561998 RepID=A0A1I7T9H6_9PELO
MSEEEPPPTISQIPSTSTCPLTVTCDSEYDEATCSSLSSSICSFLSLDFDKLTLDSDLWEGRYDQNNQTPGPQSPTQNTQNMPPTAENTQSYRTPARKSGRFSPYDVPFKLRRRRKSSKASVTKPSDMEIYLKIKLKGNVEPFRMCIFDKDNLLPKPCSVQAVRPPTPINEAEEVDELSEYFTHFVRVELKMSSLAESMYV